MVARRGEGEQSGGVSALLHADAIRDRESLRERGCERGVLLERGATLAARGYWLLAVGY